MSAEFDAIVVGSGSAGSVIARRLVDGGLHVLLLEAGPDDTDPAIHGPRLSHDLWGTSLDWSYRTTAQEAAAGRTITLPRGRVLGGSSSMNGMIYVRGAREDFDTWAYLGNDGWAYDDVLPYFVRSEDHDRGASRYHGVGGPLHIHSQYEPSPLHQAIVAAGVEAGIPYNDDPNAESMLGVGFIHFTIKDGKRHSTAAAFLRPVADDSRLRVVTGAIATRVIVEHGRAVGVEYLRGDEIVRASTSGEVIVAAGAYETPKLLMLSGIGPADELRAHGIPAVADLPGVGASLHDHVICPVIVGARGSLPVPDPGLPEMQSHLFWTSRPGLTTPDIQPLHFASPHYAPWMSGPADAFTLNVGAVRPASRGSVTLASTDPRDAPVIDLGLLRSEVDVDAIVAGIELSREMAGMPALAEWSNGELYPGDALRSRVELRDYVRRAATTYHHPVGTARMGVDSGAVVDPRLRVRGVEGLRVADASVMPMITSGNTHAPTVMIAERVSDLILADLGAGPSGSAFAGSVSQGTGAVA